MSASASSNGFKRNTADLVHDLKTRLVANYGAMIVKFPCMEETLPKLLKSDDPEEKEEKKRTIDRILRERETEYLERRDELHEELEKIISRVQRTLDESKVSIESLYSINDARSNTVLARLPKRCANCGNDDPNNVIEQRGETVCLGLDGAGTCGMVIIDHVTNLGGDKRNFEGEEDRNHFGPAPNSLMPDAFNMQTSFSFIEKGNAKFKRLQRTQMNLEMNLSNIGHEDHRTREHYKSLQKQKAFNLMKDIAPIVSIPPMAVSRASEIFALYRHVREAVQDFEAVVLACLVIAYEELAEALAIDNAQIEASKALTHQLQQQKELHRSASSSSTSTVAAKRPDPAVETLSSLQLGRFNLEQVREWLSAVPSSASSEDQELLQTCAERLVQQVDRELQSTSKPPPSSSNQGNGNKAGITQGVKRHKDISAMTAGIFGTTTMAGRYEQLKLRPSAVDDSPTAGKVLLKMNIAKATRPMSAFNQAGNEVDNSSGSTVASALTIEDTISEAQYAKVVDVFRNAIIRRSKADAVKKQQEEHAQDQERRRQPAAEHAAKRPKIEVKPEVKHSKTAMDVVVEEDADFDLEDLVGGPIAVVKDTNPPAAPSATPKPTEVAVKEEKEPAAFNNIQTSDVSPSASAVDVVMEEAKIAEVPVSVKVKTKQKKAPKIVFS